jgi:hypothetical protein
MTTPSVGAATSRAPGLGDQGPTAQEIGEQVRQSIIDAREGALQARQQAQEQAMRAAEQKVRAAEAQLRRARTPDQRGAAEQAMGAAEAELHALEQSRSTPVIVQPPMMPRDMIPARAVDIAMGFFTMCAVMVVGWPLARAFGRRIERGGGSATAVTAAVPEQLQRIEQAVEAMAIEIERISESQRFMAKLQSGASSEKSALGVGERR